MRYSRVLSEELSSSRHNDDTKQGETVISASVMTDLGPTIRELVYENPVIITLLARDWVDRKHLRIVANPRW